QNSKFSSKKIMNHKKPLKNRVFWRKKPLVLNAGTSVLPPGTKVWPAKQGIWSAKPFIPPAKQAIARARSRVRPAKQPVDRANHSFSASSSLLCRSLIPAATVLEGGSGFCCSFAGVVGVGLNRILSAIPESFTGPVGSCGLRV
ncbi:MAG: hypothetical protein MK293_14825, partial [Pedosphaera sp.]|nr:hypothetical protein [Pedosphaera sp.]